MQKRKFTAVFENKMFGLRLGKVDKQKLFNFSENTNTYDCHGNLHVEALRASIFIFFLSVGLNGYI